jgi:cold shock CspA family protein
MPTGKVKWWNDSKGYGFLTPDDGSEDVFVHFRVLEMEGFRTLREGQRVEFSIRQGAKGLHADNVRPLDDDIPPLQKGSRGTSQPVQPNRPKLKVFLCHSKGDKNAVRQLFDRLSAVPYVSPWLDEKNLLPGQDWPLEIARAVKEAECVVVCLSHSSINTEGYFHKEISFALDVAQKKPEGTIYLIPVRLEACRPPTRLERWHYVDLFVEGGFERLLLSLQYIATRLGLLLSPVTIKGTMQTDFDNDLLAYFTDVEHLRGVFKEYVTAKTLSKRLLLIHGLGGVGKSSLLRMFRLHCKGVDVRVALASGDEAKSALDVLARWTDDLKADGVAFPAFGKNFEHYRAIRLRWTSRRKKRKARSAASWAERWWIGCADFSINPTLTCCSIPRKHSSTIFSAMLR